MSRIRWTEEENELIIIRLSEIIQEDPTIRMAEGIMKAQDVLEPNRQRRKTSIQSGFSSKLLWNSAQKSLKLFQDTKKDQDKPEVMFYPKPVPLDISTVPTHEILAEAFLRVLDRLSPKKESPAQTVNNYQKSYLFSEPYEERLRVPKLGLVGLQKDQFNNIKDRVNQKKVELIYVDNWSKEAKFNKSVDYVILSSFCSHSNLERARQAVESDRVFFVPGGMSSILDKVTELFPSSLN